MHLPGALMVLAVGFGLWRVYSSLPEVFAMPHYFFWILFALCAAGIIYHKKSYKTLYYTVSLIMGASWFYVQETFPTALSYAEKMAKNPYNKIDPLFVAKAAAYFPLVIGIPAFFLTFRVLMLLQRADPVYEEREEIASPEKLARVLKKGIIKAAGTFRKTGILKKGGKPPVEDIKNEFKLYISRDKVHGRKSYVKYLDMFLHFLILGPTGSGKSYGVIKPIAWQILKYIIKGKKIGLTVVEPKGDLAEDVAGWCKKMGIPHIYINPLDENSHRFNPLQGDSQIVAESTRTVLKKLFGKQEAFFSQVQETSARNTILLLKRLHGDDLNLQDVVRVLRDQEKLKQKVKELERIAGSGDDLVQYFQKEILGSLKGEYQKFAMGLRMQLEDLMGNDMLRNIMTGNSDIDFDEHLAEGGVLIVNTAMGPLGKLGDAFGTFLIMHLQNAVFRRPGNEHTRTPHVLIIDEAPRYINPDFERLLTIGRSFRCACVLAVQSLGQLKLDEKPAFANVVMSNCRNKIIFGGLEEEDARKFEREFGRIEKTEIVPTYEHDLIKPHVMPRSYRTAKKEEPRFSYTDIIYMPKYHFICRLHCDGELGMPRIGTGLPVSERTINRYAKKRPQKEADAPVPEPPGEKPSGGIKFVSDKSKEEAVPAHTPVTGAVEPAPWQNTVARPSEKEDNAGTDAWEELEEPENDRKTRDMALKEDDGPEDEWDEWDSWGDEDD